jgi:hypothetical protein
LPQPTAQSNLGRGGLSGSQKGDSMKTGKRKIVLAVAALAVLMLLSASVIKSVSGKPSINFLPNEDFLASK